MNNLYIISAIILLSSIHNNYARKDGQCPPQFKGKCWCGVTNYLQEKKQFVVNCTNTKFTDTTILEHIPDETEVLIFTGNIIPELPSNVFGSDRNLDELRVIDISQNHIKSIHGKSFHRAPGVERLILNFNEISLTVDGSHPRLLTGFPKLRELHLTGAFASEGSRQGGDLQSLGLDQLTALQEIFITANLSDLVKLHLEQNRISNPMPRDMFCSLKSLLDLYIGDNWLSDNSLPTLSCLPKLRFIDLGRNKLTSLSKRTMNELDEIQENGRHITIDLGNNPFNCLEFCDGAFSTWLHNSNITFRNKETLRCSTNACSVLESVGNNTESSSSHNAAAIILSVLLAVLVIMIIVAVYLNRTSLSYKLNPIKDSVSRKVRYTSIQHPEEQEMNV